MSDDPHRPLSAAAAEAFVTRTCFKTGPPSLVGVELEWLLHDPHDLAAPVASSRLDGLLSPADVRGALSTEPGGQLELSSRPHPTLGGCFAETAADLAVMRAAAARAGVRLTGLGVDPVRPPVRVVNTPRYAAMERFFDGDGPVGRMMMGSTASVQVCLDAGTEGPGDDGYAARWHTLHALAPVLVAAFANSPLREGRPTGWRCTRQRVWAGLDPSRTAAPRYARYGEDPREAWTRYALDARVMAVRCPDGTRWVVPAGLTFRGWLAGEGPRPPTADDLAYHLTTLFPPVRPHGFYELRVVDAQPGDGWAVVATVVTALLEDHAARDAALAAAEPVRDSGTVAARDALTDPELAKAAAACFEAALAGAARLGVPAADRQLLADFTERYIDAGRCPADDVLDAWHAGRPLLDPAGHPATRDTHGTPATRDTHGTPATRDTNGTPATRTERISATRDRHRAPATRGRGTRPVLTESTDDALRERIATELIASRRRTHGLTTDVLHEPELAAQHSPIMSPLVWDFAHVGNQEEIWLVRDVGGRDPVRQDIDELYDAFQHPRAERPRLPLLDSTEAQRYLGTVREKAFDVLATAPLEGRRLTERGFAFGMIAQHEQQHCETMLATHQLRAGAPVLDAPVPDAPWAPLPAPEVLIPAGSFAMGTSVEPWALDNERPAHQVHVEAFWIDTAPVSAAEFAAFVADGGYDDPRWWTPEGWAYRQRGGVVAPLFWQRDGDRWLRRRFGHTEPVPPDEPVQHVSWYEADAYARWAGRRLPTEAEWEKATRHDPATGRSRRYPWGDDDPTPELANLGGAHLRPTRAGSYPAGASAYGVRQLIGDVWEWTASDFAGYPGFVAFPYREYSEVFFGHRYKVLRGGSWAVDPVACRGTFRNWDHPVRRQIFTGFRCARDAAPGEGV